MTSFLNSFDFQNINKQYKDIVSQFKENKFEIIQQLTDALFKQEHSDNYTQISSILTSLLIKECSQDNFMLQKTFNSILTNYISSDSSLKHIQTLYVLATYFNQQIIIEGDSLIRYVIQKNSEQCLRVLIFLSVVLKKRENQKDSFDLIIQQENIQQISLVKIQEPSRLIDELLKISNKTQIQKGVFQKNQIEEVNALAINCLLFLRKQMSKTQFSKLKKILYNNLQDIEIICQYNFAIICQYLFILTQNQTEFITPQQHRKLLNVITNLNDAYFQNVDINYGKVEQNTKKEIYLILEDQRLEQIKYLYDKINLFSEQILNLENNFEEKYLVKNIFEAKDQHFQLYQFICLDIVQVILTSDSYYMFVKQEKELYLQLLIQVFKLGFFEQLPIADKFSFNDEVYLKLQEIINLVLTGINENKVIAFIYKELNDIEKRCSIISKSQVISQNQEFQTDYSQKLIQEDILVVNKSDKFQVIGCFQTLSSILSKEFELKEVDLFFKFFSYMLFDPFLYNFTARIAAQLVISFKQYILLQHKQFIPQLIEVFKINDCQSKIFALDVFLNIFQDLQKIDQSQLYPYAKDLLHILIKEYTHENFFKQDITLTDGIQNFIKQILDLEDIELYLEDEIQKIEKFFLQMNVDHEKREFLIEKNHQICLCAILKIKQKLKLECNELKQNIKTIAEDLAQKIYNSSNKISNAQKTLYYKFFKILSVEILGSQQCFDSVFLQVLPSALKDGSVKNCPIIIKSRNIQYQYEELDELDLDQQEHLPNIQQGEIDDGFEDVEENQNQQNQQNPNPAIQNMNFNVDMQAHFIGEEDNEEEEEEQEQLIYEPSFQEQNFVEEALNVILTFCKESTEIFIDYKKFDIFNLFLQNLQYELIFEKSIHFIMDIILQIIKSTQVYYLKKHQEEIQSQGNSQILEQGAIEIFQMYQITVYQILKQQEDKSEDYETFLTVLISNIIKSLDKQIILILYQQFYESIMKMIFQLIRLDKMHIINVLSLLTTLFQKLPDKIIEGIKMPYLVIQGLLRHRIVYQNLLYYQESYRDEILKRPIFADMESVELCLVGFNDFFEINPQVYPIISQIYFDIISDEKYISKFLIGTVANNFLTKIVRHCKDYITPEQISLISDLLKKFEAKQKSKNSDYQFFNISFIIAKAMISIENIKGLKETKEQSNINFQKFLYILPKIIEQSQYEDARYIIQYILKSDYNFSTQETENINKFMLRVQVF
ncbi:hypothetical protein TTHERM_00241940 (macronuclear) [Tetrahymena thermophila SB210]|uniref:Uncharacterized protein n=1 Tax=Tetrahymena thermophila (strain SB210) TaxID=312017 RepID=I7MAI7_TETTS|nr:hypothetical protein TTHERM_00241940 [Tetrahymena thermophila SB210]EAS04673.2 hypothetical protein TTHERM_00241940 [Tetrahymena thermophila SB210]|eukprot:XP_001024918.2 hypothetical protein TTHERM_00241940 [Tetrahymena thermophila SB210]